MALISNKSILIIFLTSMSAVFGVGIFKSTLKEDVQIHATEKIAVPSIRYVVDAIQLLQQAYNVYSDDASRAKLYVELFQEKHPEKQWNAVVGYSAVVLSTEWYIEAVVMPAPKNKSKEKEEQGKKDKNTGVLFLLFSSGKQDLNVTVTV